MTASQWTIMRWAWAIQIDGETLGYTFMTSRLR
jgi:hypothetical protein